jgi:hypothetical protein
MQAEMTEICPIKLGDHIEFRQYGYKQDYAQGRVIRVTEKSVTVVVDRAMRRARVELEDVIKVFG